MVVYNISLKVNKAVEDEWVNWQREEHIPDIMASGQFTEYKFYRLLEEEDDETATYIVQYFAVSLDNYHYFIKHVAPILRKKASDKWSDQFVAFRSVMQSVD